MKSIMFGILGIAMLTNSFAAMATECKPLDSKSTYDLNYAPAEPEASVVQSIEIILRMGDTPENWDELGSQCDLKNQSVPNDFLCASLQTRDTRVTFSVHVHQDSSGVGVAEVKKKRDGTVIESVDLVCAEKI